MDYYLTRFVPTRWPVNPGGDVREVRDGVSRHTVVCGWMARPVFRSTTRPVGGLVGDHVVKNIKGGSFVLCVEKRDTELCRVRNTI
jgi:hypothetical protein